MSVKVFVGNLDFATTSDELKALFAEVGEVVEVSVPIDRMTGRPRGFAFVEFTISTDASVAIQRFDGHELAGRKLRVNEAADRPAQNGPDASGGGFGRPFGRSGRPARPKGSRRNIRGRKRGFA